MLLQKSNDSRIRQIGMGIDLDLHLLCETVISVNGSNFCKTLRHRHVDKMPAFVLAALDL